MIGVTDGHGIGYGGASVAQKNLGHITPTEALKNWRKIHPDLFKKSVYNLSGLDS